MRKGRSRRKSRAARPKANAATALQITVATAPSSADRPRGDDVAADASARVASAEAPAAVDTSPLSEPPLSEPLSEDGVAVKDVGDAGEELSDLERTDDQSIPPVGDLVVEEFFSEGDLSRHDVGDDLLEARVDERIARKHAPEVVLRRARFARYVTWAVAGAAAVCLAALVRTGIGEGEPSATAQPRTEVFAAPAAAAEAPPAMTAEAPQVAVEEPQVPAAEPVAEAPALEAPAEPEAEPEEAPTPPETSASAPEPAAGAASAAEEKTTARRALERGNATGAIAAGERSVALDPADGESWLILGAAYQEKGKRADARRCYAACVKQGKRGPISECRAMLR